MPNGLSCIWTQFDYLRVQPSLTKRGAARTLCLPYKTEISC